jgi:hypothetical protein
LALGMSGRAMPVCDGGLLHERFAADSSVHIIMLHDQQA